MSVTFKDDLDGTEVAESEVVRGVRLIIETSDGVHKGSKELDLAPAKYDALVALSDGDAAPVRVVFTPEVKEHRSKELMAEIRAAARAAVNPDGTPMFPGEMVRDRGRQPEVIYTWYDTEYLPAQEQAKAAAEAAEAAAEEVKAETPAKGKAAAK